MPDNVQQFCGKLFRHKGLVEECCKCCSFRSYASGIGAEIEKVSLVIEMGFRIRICSLMRVPVQRFLFNVSVFQLLLKRE